MARQLTIGGTEQRKIKEVAVAAEDLIEKTDAESAAKSAKEISLDAMVAVMKRHKLTVYRDDDAVPPLIVTLKAGKDKARVVRVKEQEREDFDVGPRVRKARSAASAAVSDALEAEGDRILANAGDGNLNDPKLKGDATRHKKAKTKTAAEIGAVKS